MFLTLSGISLSLSLSPLSTLRKVVADLQHGREVPKRSTCEVTPNPKSTAPKTRNAKSEVLGPKAKVAPLTSAASLDPA